MKVYCPHFMVCQRYKGDHKLGIMVDKRSNETMPTIDIGLWWITLMLYWSAKP